MKASDLFVSALENEGVKHVFTVPGEETLDLMESIRTSSIELVVLRHEQVAGFMAATYGRLTGKPGVCLVTLGPGATNLMTAVAHAQLGRMPMVVITGQKPIKTSHQGKFQVVDVVQMMHPLTKSAQSVLDVHKIPALVREAFHLAQEETPGVAHLELPEDVAKETSKVTQPIPVTLLHKPYASKEAIEKALQMIEEAQCPLLMVGAGAHNVAIAEALSSFLKKVDLPFFNTQMGKGVLDEWHPRFLGTAALSEGDFLHRAIEHADLILNVGHDTVEKPPFIMSRKSAKVIHINPHPAQIDETYFPQLEVIGNIAHTIEEFAQQVKRKPYRASTYHDLIKKKFDQHIELISQGEERTISAPLLVREVQKVMPRDGILAFDNGMYKIWFARNYRAHGCHTFLIDNALATMGAGVAIGMGAKYIYPSRKVVVITGDGGFLMNANALASALDLQLDLVILLLRDDGYGMIKWKQESMHFPNFGLEFGNPDFVKYAEAHGAFGARVDTIEGVAPALTRCLEAGGVHLLDVPIDYTDNHYMLGEELQSCVRALDQSKANARTVPLNQREGEK
ncbi:MAG: acetolactate synthase large subunit [Bacteroidota bacterium]